MSFCVRKMVGHTSVEQGRVKKEFRFMSASKDKLDNRLHFTLETVKDLFPQT